MIKKILQSVREYKLGSILTVVFISLEVILDVLIPVLMTKIIDVGINEHDLNVVLLIGGFLVLVALFSLIFGWLSGRFAAIASSGFAKNLRHDMYYKIQDYSFENIEKFSSSSLVTRLTTDVNNVQMTYQMLIRIAIRAPMMFLFSLLMVFTIHAKLAFIFLIVAPILGFLLFFIANKAHPLFESVFHTYDDLNNRVQENVRGIRVVKSYVQEDTEISKFKGISNKIYQNFMKAEKLVALNTPIMRLCIYSSIILISFLGSRFVVEGTLSTGELTGVITYAAQILNSLMMLSMVYVTCIISIPSMERIVEVLDEKPTIRNVKKPIQEVENGEIEFNHMNFAYVKDKPVLKDINLKIKSGEMIGIIGGIGSSKSTLVNLIPRLYDVTSGSIKVAGVDVRDYDINTLRDSVAIVLQKNVLFSGTIKENLQWGKKDATLEEIKQVCEIACCNEFISKFKDGYDTYIDQGGTNVSGGQKQRLCIARALLKSPKIIILDDSTSAVDTRTDAMIRKSFREYIPEVTKIIIAQRISSVEDCDRVIVLDNGEVSAFDTPKNLLKHNKIYQEVYYSQVKGSDRDE